MGWFSQSDVGNFQYRKWSWKLRKPEPINNHEEVRQSSYGVPFKIGFLVRHSGERRKRLRGSWFQSAWAKSEWDPISRNKLGMVDHVWNPSYMGGTGRRILVWRH
jgi:hypothetical protein